VSAKNLLLLSIALAVAVVLWVVVELAGGDIDRVEEGELFAEIGRGALDSALFAGPDDTVRLVRTQPDRWEVNGFDAVTDAGTQLGDALASARRGRLAARSSSSHARMGVDAATARRVRAFRGDEAVVDLFVGERGRGVRSVYVRPAGVDQVYAVEGELGSIAERTVTDWRDKTIVAVAPATVTDVTVEHAGDCYTLARTADGWTAGGGAVADSQRVAQLLEEFRSLTAQGAAFATAAQTDSADFRVPDRAVTLLGGEDDTLAALVFDSTDAGFWTRHRSGGTVYLLYRWKVNALTPADSVFR
jgi:hypothetical protein